ncbi:MAG: Alw26I/Eco31I/Esp3I family type II restriction endonuclease [Pygmaiobacter sp.]|nr:Alw26I/Eco31I/Esp3I family type II restriction endonuclease [Pygmaiobacter sp.]
MAREERKWHHKFIQYMDMIVNNQNYRGLRIEKKADGSYSWIATAKSETGKARIAWCENKAKELGIPIQPGVYADVMLAIHPTKWKVCQTCGCEMSLYYHYPNANFLKSLNQTFQSDYTECDHISDIWDDLIANGICNERIAAFLISKGGLSLNSCTASKQEVINALEYACRKGNKKCLGPGAMSNFPDRFDGFHTYNRCCRASQDKGRSKENLKSYTKDRRAYEYWSDGNIHAANQFMGSSFFDGISADHIGPISLGFVHDPRYLQPMTTSDNSTKRDRLQLIDIEKVIETEARTGVYPMSWYSRLIWEFIKEHYRNNVSKIPNAYRDALKQNMANFMYILWYILRYAPQNGEGFLVHAFLQPNFKYFEYSYSFNKLGEITSKTPRHFTDRNSNETERYCRIAIGAVYDFSDKENRQLTPQITSEEQRTLAFICAKIESGGPCGEIKEDVCTLVDKIQVRIILHI